MANSKRSRFIRNYFNRWTKCKRTHRPTGGAAVGPNIVSALSKTAEMKDRYKKGTKAIALVKVKNRIVGVKVREIDGKEYTIKAKAVIVATGGFGANAKMVEKYNQN